MKHTVMTTMSAARHSNETNPRRQRVDHRTSTIFLGPTLGVPSSR